MSTYTESKACGLEGSSFLLGQASPTKPKVEKRKYVQRPLKTKLAEKIIEAFKNRGKKQSQK